MRYRPHTTVKNARNLKSVSQAKPPYFEGIFKLWTHEQQELPFLQMFIRFAHQNLTIFCVKRPWNGFRFSWKFWCCMRSIVDQGYYCRFPKVQTPFQPIKMQILCLLTLITLYFDIHSDRFLLLSHVSTWFLASKFA